MANRIDPQLDFTELFAGAMKLLRESKGTVSFYLIALGLAITGFEYVAVTASEQVDFWQSDLDWVDWLIAATPWFFSWMGMFWLADFFLYRSLIARFGVNSEIGLANLVPFLLTTFLVVAAYSIASFALILPGVFVACRLSIATAILLDENVGIGTAISQSWATVKGSTRWVIVGYLLVTVPLALFASVIGPEYVPETDHLSFDLFRQVVANLLTALSAASLALVALSAHFGLRLPQTRISQVFD